MRHLLLSLCLLGAPAFAQHPDGGDLSSALALEAPPPAAQKAREDALSTYLATGEPPVLALPTKREFPFDHQVPRVTCLPYRACVIELEAGESIVGRAVGDTARWLWSELVGAGNRPFVVVKPREFDLLTNAVIVTDRRLYQVELVAPPKAKKAEELTYDARVSFWYPDDWVETKRDALQQAQAEQRADQVVRLLPTSVAGDLTALNFSYEISRPRRKALSWKPTALFDDGQRTYLRLPPSALEGEPPLVFAELPGGETAPLAALPAGELGEWLVIPTVSPRLRLVVGAGKAARCLTLVREGGLP